MISKKKTGKTLAIGVILTSLCSLMAACHTVDDNRIPSAPVYIDLSNQGIWNSYGVSGFGDYQYFIMQSGSSFEPAGFPYNAQSATGFGGILLIEGMDPYTSDTLCPLAYDLSCPVEKSPEIRVRIENENYEAVCPVCDSHYDVTMAAGAPTAGPAADKKYGLTKYYCIPTSLGGYYIKEYQY